MIKLSKNHLKKVISSALVCTMTATMLQCFPDNRLLVNAEETNQKYPYTMFAASSNEGAITVNANNFCVNGNVATNGTIVSSGNTNINGTRIEHTDESMLYVLKKLNYLYFSGENVETYTEDYVLDDLNININNPIDVDGAIDLIGSINLNSGIKAVDDITINGEVKNSNNTVICSETGDINIETSNVNFNGLIYAPYGDIVIDSDNLNLNNVVIIGQTITIDCPNVNANYSSSMASLIGNESDIDVELYAMGSYNADANAIDIEWYTNYANSSYDILSSDDNETYTLIDTISDATTYQYVITDDFNQKYIKVFLTTNYGQYVESIPFIVRKTDEGYITDYMDSDEDGLPDILEIQIGTNINSQDTDEDDLTDYQEVFVIKTDPLVWDSVLTGTSDADVDIDSDSLSNIEELNMGTDPRNDDTDYDHLKDGVEISYGTNPLNPDSDGDTILDGDEDVLGFNPLEFDSNNNGISDGDEYVKQTVNEERYDSTLFENNSAVPSLDEVTAKGNVNSNIKISEYNGYLKGEERSYVGKAIEISNSDISEGKLSFVLSADYSVKEYDLFGETTNGLVICYNNGEETTPLDTTYDADNRTLSANITAQGYYFVLDVVDWINSLGLELNDYVIEAVVETARISTKMLKKAPAKASASIADIKIKGQVDIVFVIDTTGSMGSYIDNVKNNIKSFVDDIESAGIKPNFALVKYEDIIHDGDDSTEVKKNGSSNWFMNVDKFKDAISKLKLGDGGDRPETAIDGLEMAHQLDMRNSAQKFIILVTDADYKVTNNFGIKSMEDLALSLKSDKISTSVVTANMYKDTYKILYDTTDGIIADINGNFKDELIKLSDKINEETNNGYWIALKGLIPQIVKLDEEPSSNSTADTDTDDLLDIDELKSLTPTSYTNISVYLHALGANDLPNYELPVFDYYSNPTKEDTDGDGYLDGKAIFQNGKEVLPKDPKPLKYEVIPYIEDLCKLATEYESNFNDSQKLVLDYIRAGKYNDNEYLGSGNWENTSGEVDSDFIEYVDQKMPEIRNYLYSTDENDTKYIKDPISGGLIDFSHLAATSSAYLFDTSGFKMWGASTFFGYPNYSEDDIDNLAGWAGDLQSMIQTDLLIYYDYTYGDNWIGDHYFSKETLKKYSSDYYKNLVFNLLECKKQDDYNQSTHILLDGYRIRNTFFGKSDQLADVDAVNLFVNCYRPNNKTTICDCLNEYYAIKDNSRFCRLRFDVFIGNVFSMDDDFSYQSKEWDYQKSYWDGNISREEYKTELCNLFSDYVYKYTKENTPGGKKWTLYKNAPVTDEVSMGAAKAFSEYIISNWSW